MNEQWITVRFEGDKALRKQIAEQIDRFLRSNGVSGVIGQDETPGFENESDEVMIGLANNETTLGPIDGPE